MKGATYLLRSPKSAQYYFTATSAAKRTASIVVYHVMIVIRKIYNSDKCIKNNIKLTDRFLRDCSTYYYTLLIIHICI